jgi:hypothetical protein
MSGGWAHCWKGRRNENKKRPISRARGRVSDEIARTRAACHAPPPVTDCFTNAVPAEFFCGAKKVCGAGF